MARVQTVRINADLFLSSEERRQLEAKAAAELRTPSNFVTRAVLAALGRKRPVKTRTTPAKRTRYSIKLRLTAQERRELKRRAEAEGRLVTNLVNAIVVRELGKG
jgi:uncharacterized protein (DUF1778 family)